MPGAVLDDPRGTRTETTVLFLAANPVEVPLLQLGEECRAIEDKIRAARFRERLRFRSRWAVRPDDLLQALHEDDPAVLHFSGHGAAAQGLCFLAEDGGVLRVSSDGLGQVIRAAGDSIQLVVLNACYTRVQAEALVAHVPCVIGMPSAIADKSAIVYAAELYRAIAFGKSVASAHQCGLAALALHSMAGNMRDVEIAEAVLRTVPPELIVRIGVDAGHIHIVQDALSMSAVPASSGESRIHLEIDIDADFEALDASTLSKLVSEVCRLSGGRPVRILCVAKGSVRLSLSFEPDAAKALLSLRHSGRLDQIGGLRVSNVIDWGEVEISPQTLDHADVAQPPSDPRVGFASAAALEESAVLPAPADVPGGNPYLGLAAFESAHAALFFGRQAEIRELVDRVRLEPLVVVGGDSGTGKSSLCRAGVLPWLAEHDGWSRIDVVPGRDPLRSLAAALAPWTDDGEAALAEQLRDDPDVAARAIGQRPVTRGFLPGRLLVFVDQLEELLTLSPPREGRLVAAAIAALALRSPSVHVLATARADFLSRLAMLPGLGDKLVRGLYFLRPLGGDQIREAIVRPAAARGVVYESESLIEQLVAHTEDAPGGLPLLQFTLAELWDARDVSGRTIQAEALVALGGVAGALTRHADRLLAGLDARERDAARRILLRLVTVEGTRTRRSRAELISDGPEGDAERAALEALVRGRVLVASNAQDVAYEIAHEALLTSWSTLQGWLQRGAAEHALRLRVEQAAVEWERLGRPSELLWGRRRLTGIQAIDPARMAPREAVFLARSRAAVRRTRTLGIAAAALLAIFVVAIGLAVRARARRELEAVIADQIHAATGAFDDARRLAGERDAARSRAFGLFDAQRWTDGEALWDQVEALAVQEAGEYRAASSHFESALSLEPASRSLRAQFADLTFERLLRAEHDHRGDLADELRGRLEAYDDGRYDAMLARGARVELEIDPPGAQVWSERPGAPRQRLGEAPLAPLTLPPGSVILVFEAPGRFITRLPVLLARGETLRAHIALPLAGAAPPGMLYVPAGRFLFGSADMTDARRQLFNTVPLHEVSTPAYYIARHEVTFGEWIEFLDELPRDERRQRSPRSNLATSAVLTEIAPRRWRLIMTPTTRTYTAETGQRLHYERRTKRADQDWTRFPVSAVSFEDATAFAAWLDRTGRIPGARLCDEYEWERAARGADARTFPSGSSLVPDDANIDITYGREPLAFGPDEVGSHPASRSPVGADDMAGNVWEWTRSVQTPETPVVRGGSWYQGELTARSVNRDNSEPTLRSPLVGLRLCATPPP